MQCSRAVGLLLLLTVAAALRQGGAVNRTIAANAEEPKNNIPAIEKKWDKMDDFLEAMFTISCKWKHGKDVNGLTAEKLKDGHLKLEKVEEFKKETQAKNVQQLGQACGNIVAKGEGKCRQSCADRWGDSFDERSQCDGKCVANYGNFEKRCRAQSENLEKVYSMKIAQASSRKRCYEGFCGDLPSVWLKDNDKMGAEVDTQCGKLCTPELVEMRCKRKWQMEVDFVKDEITSSCHGSGKAQDCMKDKTTEASEAQDTCATDGKTTCGTQFDKCKKEGKVDETFKEAKDFCESRKQMCQNQVTESCLKKHKAALDTGKQECESEDSGALKACRSEKLKAKETETVKKCSDEKAPKCTEDCKGKCNVAKMNECLGNLESDVDATEDFCKNFWGLLHESSEVDPVSGNPIVFLSK